ncbi:hypothetical protein JXC34_03140 [Candidatus Woesearchaeota archaeon]|nr:hypothetical protein [Candidatus Woesearchaeota archaeon]
MALPVIVISLLALIFVFLVSALPLYFAIKFLGGKTTLFKTAFVALISGIIVSAIKFQFKTFGGILAFFVLIWIYHEVFRLKWFKAFVAWILQFVFLAIFYVIALFLIALVVGVSVLGLLL